MLNLTQLFYELLNSSYPPPSPPPSPPPPLPQKKNEKKALKNGYSKKAAIQKKKWYLKCDLQNFLKNCRTVSFCKNSTEMTIWHKNMWEFNTDSQEFLVPHIVRKTTFNPCSLRLNLGIFHHYTELIVFATVNHNISIPKLTKSHHFRCNFCTFPTVMLCIDVEISMIILYLKNC